MVTYDSLKKPGGIFSSTVHNHYFYFIFFPLLLLIFFKQNILNIYLWERFIPFLIKIVQFDYNKFLCIIIFVDLRKNV